MGAAGEVDAVRDAAREAVHWACEGATRVGVLTSSSEVPEQTETSLKGFGVSIGSGPAASLPVGMGSWYLAGRAGRFVGPDDSLRHFDAVLVLGDGSAARTEKAPKHFHPGAIEFDESVVAALTSGDHTALARLDLDLADEVGAAGAPAWVRLAAATAGVTDAEVDVADDPYGVLYVVARWTVRWADPA